MIDFLKYFIFSIVVSFGIAGGWMYIIDKIKGGD